ncbi:MAG: GspH/FimT family pseudopilin [Pseudomonadota bacterium]
MDNSRGFTLIELLVVITIAVILTALAAPSFTRLTQSNTISSNVNTFLADMRFARSEAIRLGGAVVMCRSDAPEASSPVCGSGSGPGGNGWVSGWIIFQDLNNNGTKVATEPLLRVQAPITSMDSIVETGSSSSTKIRFTTTGRLLNLSSATQIQFGGGNYANDVQRVVCVSLGGRARIAGNGLTSCGTGTEVNQ